MQTEPNMPVGGHLGFWVWPLSGGKERVSSPFSPEESCSMTCQQWKGFPRSPSVSPPSPRVLRPFGYCGGAPSPGGQVGLPLPQGCVGASLCDGLGSEGLNFKPGPPHVSAGRSSWWQNSAVCEGQGGLKKYGTVEEPQGLLF